MVAKMRTLAEYMEWTWRCSCGWDVQAVDAWADGMGLLGWDISLSSNGRLGPQANS